MRTVVLAGGLSTEREVSISSGTLVAEALRSKGHEVVLLELNYLDVVHEQEELVV